MLTINIMGVVSLFVSFLVLLLVLCIIIIVIIVIIVVIIVIIAIIIIIIIIIVIIIAVSKRPRSGSSHGAPRLLCHFPRQGSRTQGNHLSKSTCLTQVFFRSRAYFPANDVANHGA